MGLKKDILQKIKDNEKQGKPEIHIDDSDTFDIVVDKFQLKNRQRQLKKIYCYLTLIMLSYIIN